VDACKTGLKESTEIMVRFKLGYLRKYCRVFIPAQVLYSDHYELPLKSCWGFVCESEACMSIRSTMHSVLEKLVYEPKIAADLEIKWTKHVGSR
jgi:hypothetical protein